MARFELTVLARACGPRLGRRTSSGPSERSRPGSGRPARRTVLAGGIELLPGSTPLDGPGRGELPTRRRSARQPGWSCDTTVTPELASEGSARHVVRVVQQARRDAGLDISDRIILTLHGPARVLDAARAHQAFLAGEVLATAVVYAELPARP